LIVKSFKFAWIHLQPVSLLIHTWWYVFWLTYVIVYFLTYVFFLWCFVEYRFRRGCTLLDKGIYIPFLFILFSIFIVNETVFDIHVDVCIKICVIINIRCLLFLNIFIMFNLLIWFRILDCVGQWGIKITNVMFLFLNHFFFNRCRGIIYLHINHFALINYILHILIIIFTSIFIFIFKLISFNFINTLISLILIIN